MKGRRLLRALLSIGYEVQRQEGSHRVLVAPGRPRLIHAYGDGDEIGPVMVRKILVGQVGLSVEEALEVARRG